MKDTTKFEAVLWNYFILCNSFSVLGPINIFKPDLEEEQIMFCIIITSLAVYKFAFGQIYLVYLSKHFSLYFYMEIELFCSVLYQS